MNNEWDQSPFSLKDSCYRSAYFYKKYKIIGNGAIGDTQDLAFNIDISAFVG